MAKINIYETQVNMQPADSGQVNEKLFTSGGVAIQEQAQVLEEVNQKFKAIRDLTEVTKANTDFNEALSSIETQALNDPDTNNISKYQQQIAETKAKYASGITDSTLRLKALSDFDTQGFNALSKVQMSYRSKQIAQNEYELNRALGAQETSYLTAIDDVTRKSIMDKSLQSIQENMKLGTISPEMGRKYQTMILDDWKTNLAKYQIFNDTSTEESQSITLADLRKADKYPYSEIPASERIKLIKESQDRIFQNNQTFKRQITDEQNARYDGVINKLMNRDLTLADIDAELSIDEKDGGLKRKQLLDFKEGLIKNVESDLKVITTMQNADGEVLYPKASEYLKFITNFIDSQTDREQAMEYLAAAYHDGILDPKTEAPFLNQLQSYTRDIEWNRKSGVFKSAVDGIKSWFKMSNKTDAELALSIKELINRMSGGEQALDVVSDIQKREVIKTRPEVSTFPKEGQLMMDINGNKAIVFPDGSYKPFHEYKQ